MASVLPAISHFLTAAMNLHHSTMILDSESRFFLRECSFTCLECVCQNTSHFGFVWWLFYPNWPNMKIQVMLLNEVEETLIKHKPTVRISIPPLNFKPVVSWSSLPNFSSIKLLLDLNTLPWITHLRTDWCNGLCDLYQMKKNITQL